MLRKLPIYALLITIAGCTHVQLQRTTVKQISTWSDLQYQQTMNNLAMFCANPSSLPYYSVTGAGVTQLTDSANVGTALLFPPFDGARVQAGLNGGVGRQLSEQWSLAPTTDPGRLEIIRSLFQYVATGMISDADRQKTNDFFGVDEWERWGKLQTCWFHVGSKRDIPKCACYVGNYCDTYVWVADDGCEGLTQLTLALLDVVTADPDPVPSIDHFRLQQISGNKRKDVFHVERYTTKGHMSDDGLPGVLSNAASLLDDIPKVEDPKQRPEIAAEAAAALSNLLPFVANAEHRQTLQLFIKDLQARNGDGLPNDAAEKVRGMAIEKPSVPRRMGRLNYYSPTGLQFVPRK